MSEWETHMRRGDFAAAWRVSDTALRSRAGQPCWHWPRHLQYIWDGRPLAGQRVLVRCYHGLGDTVQFARFAAPLRKIAREVIFWAQPPLLPLLTTAPGIDRLLPLHDGTPDVEYDVDVESMELAHIFRPTVDTLPRAIPYFNVPSAPTPPPDGILHVGLVWRTGDWNGVPRSIPTALIADFAASAPGVAWHIFQRGPALTEWPRGLGIDSGTDDVLTFARRLRALDLLISVDSFPAHLASALAVPTWLLLPQPADWRWLDAPRRDSPWYPTLRLFRQRTPGEWPAVLAEVQHALTLLDKPSDPFPPADHANRRGFPNHLRSSV